MTARYMQLISVKFQGGNYLEVTHNSIYIYIFHTDMDFYAKIFMTGCFCKYDTLKKTMTKIIVQ